MVRLSVSLLGPFQVALDGQPVAAFESAKVRALLAYLAVDADRVHRRQSLAGLLWPDLPERSARANLRHALSLLRDAIGDRLADPPFLMADRDTIRFDAQSDYWLDVAAFRGLVASADAGIEHLEQAIALCRAEFLQGFSLADSVAFEEWTILHRDWLHRDLVDALRRLTALYEQGGNPRRAIERSRRWAELAPWDEGAHRALMRLLALDGRRSEALAQYDACARLLREELDVAPAPETIALRDRIRDGTLDATDRQAVNLPVPLMSLVGRRAALAEVLGWLRDPGCRLLTIVGPGGCGKTRLALEAAREATGDFEDGVCVVPLAPLEPAVPLAPVIAQSVGLVLQPEGDPRAQVLYYLRGKRMLLLLDNMEHVLASGAALVADILAAAPGVKCLVTTRARLNLRDEQLYPLSGMRFPDPDELVGPGGGAVGDDGYGAVDLFLHAARRARPDFAPDDEDQRHIFEICRWVDGMPLGILLSASWIEMLTPGEIASELAARDLDFLDTDWADAPERHRSMRAVLDQSWRLLSGHQQRVMAALSVFRGGFAREAAEAVAGASLRDLLSLVGHSLLHRTSASRFDLHDLWQQFASEKLDQSVVEAIGVRDAHAAYYAAALKRWETISRSRLQGKALIELDMDAENARAAWNWATASRNLEILDLAIEGFGRLYWSRGRSQEGETACREVALALSRGEGERSALQQLVLARALAWQAICSWNPRRKHGEVARAMLEQSLRILDALEQGQGAVRSARAFALLWLGNVGTEERTTADAQRYLSRSLALYRQQDDLPGAANVLLRLGHSWLTVGDLGKARPLFEESMAILRSMGDKTGMLLPLTSVARDTISRGDFSAGERLLEEGMMVLRDTGDFADRVHILRRLGQTHLFLGRFRRARILLEESSALCRTWERKTADAWCGLLLGSAESGLGRYDQARAHAEASIEFFREFGPPIALVMALSSLAKAELAAGGNGRAQRILDECATICRSLGRGEDLGIALAQLGLALRGLGRVSEARRCLREALQLAVESGSVFPLEGALPAIALLLADQGDVERASELYALALRFPSVANSRYYYDVAGRHIAAAAAVLPPEAVTEAKERGRNRDLWDTVAELVAELA